MENLIGKWGGTNLNNIYVSNETQLVHPDDWLILKDYKFIRSLHKCLSVSSDYISVKFGNTEIRIKNSIFYPLDVVPEFQPLEKVKLKNSKGDLEFGIVKGIHWHNNDRKFYYDIEVNNKIKGRRYFSDDLESNEN
jgi:hypothetical protein